MANRWFIRAITFKWNASSQAYVVDDTYQFGDVVSAKLTLRRGDTSILKVTTTPSSVDNPEPVKSLVEVLFGATFQSAERKFFGTITKRTYTQPEGLYSYEAVGVLGSYKFLPNYDGYANSATIGDVITTERKRFRNEYAQSAPQYTPSAWELIYTGQAQVPTNFGMLYDNYISGALTCNLDSLQKNSKNAYEFIKAVTKEGSYLRGANQTTWGTWVEEAETATFTAISTFNTQEATYDENLISLTFEDNPFYTHVDAVNKDSKQGVSHNKYPNPFYYARIRAKDKATGNAYTSTELQNFANAEMTRDGRVAEAICFDRHVCDDSIPWFDMRKKVALRYKYITGTTTSQEMEILEITYDLCNSANDRVKLGASQTPLTDYTENAESVQSSGGTMTGDIIRTDGNNSYNITELAKKNVDEEYYSSQSVAQTTSLGDTGVKVTLPKGWYMINAQVVANRTGLSQIALAQVYSAGNIRILAFNEVRTFGSNSVGRLQCSWCGYIDETSNNVSVWTKCGGTAANTVSIWAKRIASDIR